MNDAPQTISFEQVRRTVSRRRWVIVQLVVVGAIAGLLFALTVSRDQTATATVLVTSGMRAGAEARGALSADVAARLVRTRAIGRRVGKALGDRRPVGELLAAVSVRPDDSRAFIEITARDEDRAGAAARLANAFAEQFIAERGETSRRRAQRAIAVLERQLAALPRNARQRSALAAELAEAATTAALGGLDAELVDRAVPAAVHREAEPLRWSAIGAALGLLLGIVVAFSAEALDPRVRRVSELRRLIDAPQLAALPRLRVRRGRKPGALTESREPFDHLRSGLLVLTGTDALRRVLVTSPSDRSEGSASVAAHLAASLVRLGVRVCVVDCDLRRPGIGAQLGLDDAAPGLADAIRGTPVEQVVQSFSVPAGSATNGSVPRQPLQVSVLAAGGASPDEAAELLIGDRVERVLQDLGRSHDVVIVLCAPVLAVGDALSLLAPASGTILVVRHSHTQRRDVGRAAQVINDAGGSLLGVVVTGVPKGELAADGHGPWPSAAARTAGVP